jgi:hypothetical protein
MIANQSGGLSDLVRNNDNKDKPSKRMRSKKIKDDLKNEIQNSNQ